MEIKKPDDLNVIFVLNYNSIINQVIDDFKYKVYEIDVMNRLRTLFQYKNKLKLTENQEIELSIINFKETIKIERCCLCENHHGRYIHINISEVNKKDILNGLVFAISEFKEDSIYIKRYIIKENCENLEICEDGVLSLSTDLKETIKRKRNKEEFFNGICDICNFHENMMTLLFEKFKTYPGMKDIYFQFKKISNKQAIINRSFFIVYEFYKNLLDDNYFYRLEVLIKQNLTSDLENTFEENPIFTKHPFIIPKTYPKMITDFIKRKGVKSLYIDRLSDKISIKEIEDFIELYKKYNYIYEKRRIFSYCNAEVYFEHLVKVIEKIEIQPKVLINRIIKYCIENNRSIVDYLILILDFYEMNKMLGKTVVTIPKNLLESHHQLSEQINELKRIEEINGFKNQSDKNKQLINKLPFNKKYTILSPEKPEDLIREGQELHHCVGSYINKYINETSKIFFVRRKEEIDKPFVTLELNKNNNLVQIRGYRDSNPDNDVRSYVRDWVNIIGGIIYE